MGASRTVMAATQARIRFGELLRRVVDKGEIIVVERDGSPQAVVMSVDEYERLSAGEREVAQWELALRQAGEVGSRIRARRETDLPDLSELDDAGGGGVQKQSPQWEEALVRAGDVASRIQSRRTDRYASPRSDSVDPPRAEVPRTTTVKPTKDSTPRERRDPRALPSPSDTIRHARGERDAGLDDSLGVR